MNLTPASLSLVYQAVREALAPYAGDELIGVSCIVQGADSIFAQVVLDLGGKLKALLPAANYRETKVNPSYAEQFDEFMRRATTVHVMPFDEANRDAYEARQRKANVILRSATRRLGRIDRH